MSPLGVLLMSQFSATHPIAFFCAEYGIEAQLPIYAGGLGILAGDILKEAAEQKLPMVGVGLLYRGEGAAQKINTEGMQEEVNVEYDPLSVGLEHVYLDDMPLFIKVHLTQTDVWVRCWQKKLGSTVTLYLLDTDTDQNHASERSICSSLYVGTEEALLKQQLILGIGGVKLLHALGIHPSLYHVNEGRPSFLHWQLIRSYMDEHGMTYEQAQSLAISKTVYTNHTLVGAGNSSHSADLLRAYSHYYAERMGISVDKLLEPGLTHDGSFNPTQFALNIASKVSAVSQLHYRLCQEAWPQYQWSGITNGVHMPQWQDSDLKAVSHTPALLWQVHQDKKQQLADFVQQQTGFGYDPNRLVITWARRITGYKQLAALFGDLARLKQILSAPGREVQLLVAGKAHAYDAHAKQLIQQIITYFSTELSGYALFVPNYNIEVAKQLVRGSDAWLNTPEYGMEASGTSGMKAISNGVLQVTVPDGWAAEVDWVDKGWQLDPNAISETVYHLLEEQIVPEFYERDAFGTPQDWVKKMQRSIELSSHYSAERMLKQYIELLYR